MHRHQHYNSQIKSLIISANKKKTTTTHSYRVRNGGDGGDGVDGRDGRDGGDGGGGTRRPNNVGVGALFLSPGLPGASVVGGVSVVTVDRFDLHINVRYCLVFVLYRIVLYFLYCIV